MVYKMKKWGLYVLKWYICKERNKNICFSKVKQAIVSFLFKKEK